MAGKPRLTIGMAHHTDFYGVYFTIQSARKQAKSDGVLDQIELVVIDNSPGNEHGRAVEESFKAGWIQAGTAGGKYVQWDQYDSTSQTRNLIFQHATADHVLAVDCHVLLEQHAIKRLIEFYAENPETRDLYSGPLDHDTLTTKSTHFDDVWGAEMRGRWGAAWQCGCGDGIKFGCIVNDTDQQNLLTNYKQLEIDGRLLTSCYNCKKKLPKNLPWHNHEQAMAAAGFEKIGQDIEDTPFEIPGQGLGLFSCKRDAWLGFNPHTRGFGAEEMCVHEVYKQSGQKTMCLPFLCWVHRFRRVGGVPYTLTQFNKARNYVLWYQQLGRDMAELEREFVTKGGMSEVDWGMLVANPIEHLDAVEGKDCRTCGKSDDGASGLSTLEEVYHHCIVRPRDLDQHMDTLKDLASKVKKVTEFTARRESTVAFAAGLKKPGSVLKSYQAENDAVLDRLPELVNGTLSVDIKRCDNSDTIKEIDKCDLLFLDTEHTYDKLTSELTKFAPKASRFIVMHDTKEFAESGQDGRPAFGLMTAIRDYCKKNPEWSVIKHHTHQHGLTVLGRMKKDKPKLPPLTKQLTNFAKHMKEHIQTGRHLVDAEMLETRTNICATCPMRVENRCGACGCPLEKKAPLAASYCDLGYWPELEVTK